MKQYPTGGDILDESWLETSNIPKDGQTIEVVAPPHGRLFVHWHTHAPHGMSYWKLAEKKEIFAMPITPIAWCWPQKEPS